MRITLTIDDQLYQQALAMADPGVGKADLFREAMRTYVRVQAAKRLASLGAAAPEMRDIPGMAEAMICDCYDQRAPFR